MIPVETIQMVLPEETGGKVKILGILISTSNALDEATLLKICNFFLMQGRFIIDSVSMAQSM